MAGRGTTTFQKRHKEMQRKERQQEKFAKRIERKKQAETDVRAGAGDQDKEDADAAPASDSEDVIL